MRGFLKSVLPQLEFDYTERKCGVSQSLIINADDFGYSDHTVGWTVKCFEAGVLSSATIMVGAAAVGRAVEFAKENPQWSFGLHLCLTDERPLCLPSEIPSMVTHEGLLWPTRVFMIRSALGMIRREHLEKEIRAQVKSLCDLGVHMSHLDGHGHIHRMPFVMRSLITLAKEIGMTCIRPAQDLYYQTPRCPAGRWLNSWVNRSLRTSFFAPDHFLMTSGKITAENAFWFRDVVKRLPEGCTEIGVHPGMDEPWRKLDTECLFKEGAAILTRPGIALTTYHCLKR